MKLITLHCEAGNHDWERPSQRGVRPKSCPACKAASATAQAVAAPAPAPLADPILVALYADETGLSEKVCAALLAADLEPPQRQRVDRIGYTVAERKALDAVATVLPTFEA